MQASRFNIVSRATGSGQHFVVNLLSRCADTLTAGEADVLSATPLPDAAALARSGLALAELAERGYVVEPDDEERRYRQAYLDFVEGRETDEVQLFYAPTYACNFACDYCYQEGYAAQAGHAPDEVLAAFLGYVDQAFAGRRKYVTLFGGEPLLPSASSERVLATMAEATAARGLDLAIVTNGYRLAEAVPMLRRGKIREVQVTLDGTEAVHDRRRPLRGGGGTFGAIVRGIDACLAADLPVNLRVVVDRDNIEDLPALALYAVSRSWTSHPRFVTQLGRNYELHSCQRAPARLFDRLELAQAVVALAQRHPALLDFHRPALSVARVLFDQGELPEPLFDACPGCKTEWAFDYTGRIYPCTATVGKHGEEVGRFHPTVELDQERISRWQERDVLAIDACRGCALQLACGGGCGAVAKNRTGDLHAPDCRPVRELLELGFGLYGPKEE